MQLPAQQRQLAPDVVTDLVNPRHASDTALGFMMVPAVLVRLLLPIALVVSFYLFMRGHNQPGGGFVAGLVMSVAFILQYMVAGTQWVEAQMSLRPLRWMGTGLLSPPSPGLAHGGRLPVPDHPHLAFHLPLLGDMHMASALFFDIGVYAVVVGSTLLILTALGHQSVRAHKPSNQAKVVATTEPPDGRSHRNRHRRAGRLRRLILRPRTFQVVMGLCLLSYGVNLFIFSMGSLFIGKEPIIKDGVPQDLLHYTDPLPQALVLTAIVISFAMTALFLVVLLASRG
jgi:multicomponent K+:H+ antiporter subunit A